MLKIPTLSVAIATYNSGRTLDRCLKSISSQKYNSKIEVVLADGGSSDDTEKIAQQYSVRVIPVSSKKQNAEYNKGIAVNASKNDVLILIDHDNELPHDHWFQNMIAPLLGESDCFGSGVLRFDHDESMTSLDRYNSLIGTADPVTFFLNKSAHQSWLYSNFHLRAKIIKETPDYYLVNLNPDSMPALGGNGAAIWRKLLINEASSDPDHFFHIDVHVDLVRTGHMKYAFVKDTIKHYSNNTIIPFLQRRKYYIDKYYYIDYSKRRYSVFDKKYDIGLLILYVIYSLSIIGPLYHSVKGYTKIQDSAWFIHPFMCLALLFFYGSSTLKNIGSLKDVKK